MDNQTIKYLKAIGTENDIIGFDLWRAANIWKRTMKNNLAPLNLTPSRFLLLSSIAWHEHNNEDPTQSLLAKHTGTDVMTVSQLARKLEIDGFITRQRSSLDKRSRIVQTTPQGRKALSTAILLVSTLEKTFFTFSQGDRPTIQRFFRRMIDFIQD